MYLEKHVKQAIQSIKISEVSDEDLFNSVKEAVAKCYADTLFKLEKEEAEYSIRELCKIIREKYFYYGISEIRVCFRNGVMKKYGDYFGLSLVTFVNFLEKYSEERREIKATIKEPERLLPARELKVDDKEYFDFIYNTWLNKGICMDYGNVLYRKLETEGTINYTAEEKWEFWEMAKAQIEHENSQKCVVLSDYREMQKTLEKLENGTLDNQIKSRAMRLALIDYFNTLKNK
jgi:hypothetical protein